MTNISGTQLLIYVSGLFLVLLLLGLFGSKYLTFDTEIFPQTVENLTVPSVSSSSDVAAGASQLYGWGYTPITKPHKKKQRRCSYCENIFVDKEDVCIQCNGEDKDCRYADITQNVDIDKYVLKSSVPPCPDLTEYAKKNQIPPYPFNKEEWILKSAIPPCPQMPNMEDYIRKSEVPNCTQKECPECPVCPISPTCPPCNSEKIKVVENIVYRDRPVSQEEINYQNRYGYLPNNINYYPQSGGTWTPKLSELNEGFVSEPMVPSLHMARCMDAMPKKI